MSYVARDVTVRIGSATLLEGVTVEVRPGELVAVAGPNGAGKSSLVGILAGDRRPTQGSASLDGHDLAGWSRTELARRRAVMGTSHEVAFDLDVEQVALLGRLPVHGGDPDTRDREIVRDLLEAVDCLPLASRRFSTLSTGERQRVALARALAQVAADGESTVTEERYLLLDEPTSSLDPAHQHLAMGLLRRQTGAGRGVLAVLHDLNLAAAYADRIVLMARGRVVADGPTEQVLRPEVLEPVFGIPMLVMPHASRPYPVIVAVPPQSG
jgi:iron complex transport system ATP-binding protein